MALNFVPGLGVKMMPLSRPECGIGAD